jgi:hypothetical protein
MAMVEAPGQGSLSRRIQLRVTMIASIIGAQRFVPVAAVHVHQVGRLVEDLAGDGEGDALGLGAVRPAGVDPVQVLAVGVAVHAALVEGGRVRQVNEDHRPRHAARVEALRTRGRATMDVYS